MVDREALIRQMLADADFAEQILREINASGMLGKGNLAGKAMEVERRLSAGNALWREREDIKNLPIIIDGPGQYIMRNGNIAVIDVLKENTAFTFQAHGTRPINGKKKKGRDMWTLSGRNRAIGTCDFDIVQKFGG